MEKRVSWSAGICAVLLSMSAHSSPISTSTSHSFAYDEFAAPGVVVETGEAVAALAAQYFSTFGAGGPEIRGAVMPPTVPEPSTTTLIGLALALVVYLRARKQT